MDRHFTIPEAVQLTGKSESTIKRLIRELRDNPGHPERSQLQPSHEEYEQCQRSGDAYAWRISEHLLRHRFGLPTESPSDDAHQRSRGPTRPSTSDGPDWREIVAELRDAKDTYKRQLEIKDMQIKSITQLAVTHANALSEQIHAASVQLRRMGTQLQLREAGVSHVVKPATTEETEKNTADRNWKLSPDVPGKARILSHLFRRRHKPVAAVGRVA